MRLLRGVLGLTIGAGLGYLLGSMALLLLVEMTEGDGRWGGLLLAGLAIIVPTLVGAAIGLGLGLRRR